MQQPGLNSEINVGNKRLHIQSSLSESSKTIVAHVFEKGRIVESRELSIDEDKKNGELQIRLKSLHDEIVADLQLLFYIAEKVKQVKHPSSCNKLGLLFFKKGFIDDALTAFELAIAGKPEMVEAYNNAGLCHFARKDYDKAEEKFIRGLKHAKEYADLYLNLARLYVEKKHFTKAITFLGKALSINKNYYSAHYLLGLALLNSINHKIEDPELPPLDDRIALAKKCFAHASVLPNINIELLAKANVALQNRLVEASLELYTNAYKVTTTDFNLTFEHEFYLKFMYGGKGKDNKFIGSYIDELCLAIENNPGYADLHNNLGIAYLIMCRNLFLKALEEFRKALRINPSFKHAEKNLKLAENDGKGFLILLRAILK